MKPRSFRREDAAGADRTGATLTEVLMSLLILSIGILSVFSLYPIAVLRAIQATNLSNARLVAANAEMEIRATPELVNGAPPWQPNTNYRVGDLVTAPLLPNGFPTVPGRFVCSATAGAAVSGPVQPNWPSAPNDTVVDGNGTNGVTWLYASDPDPADAATWLTAAPYGALSDRLDLSGEVFVVDPFGWSWHHNNGTPESRDTFGAAARFGGAGPFLVDDGGGSRTLGPLGSPTLTVGQAYGVAGELTSAQLLAVQRAAYSAADTWETLIDVTPAGFAAADGTLGDGPSTVQLPTGTGADLASLATTAASLEAQGILDGVRLVLRTDTNASVVRTVSTVAPLGIDTAARELTVGELTPAMLNVGAIDPTTISRLQVEVRDGRYSWMVTRRPRIATANKQSEARPGNIVVFFNRSFDLETEVGFECAVGDDPLVDGPPADVDANRAWVRTTRVIDGVTYTAPINVGGHMFDSSSGLWYRVRSIIDDNLATLPGVALLELDRDVEISTPNERDDTNAFATMPGGNAAAIGGLVTPQAVFPRGVIRVFPLEKGI